MTQELELASGIIYQARPRIEIDGSCDDMVQTLLLGMEMQEAEGGLSSLELRFTNTATMERSGVDFAFEYSDNDLLSLGKSIRVLAGDENDPQEIFSGIISGLELVIEDGRQPELIVLAEDALQKARLTRLTRLHSAGPLRDIVEAIANEMGMRATITALNDVVDAQMQLNESDLAFLRRLLRRYDADLQVVGDELHVSPRLDVQRNIITLEINSQLRNVRVTADLADHVTQVTFSGWDVSQGQPIKVTSDAHVIGPGNGKTGAQILQDAFGERSEHVGDAAVADEREAQALVNACYTQCARRFVRVRGTAEGNPGLRVGSHVTLQGIGPRFENTYYVTRAWHRYDTLHGYQTEFEAETSYFGG